MRDKIIKKQRRMLGAILKINLENETYAFGRVLKEPLVAFYKLKTKKIPPIKEIIKCPVLFVLPVYNYAITHGIWEIIGKHPLEEFLLKEPLFFKYDQLTEKLVLYKNSTKEETPISWEEYKDHESAAVWGPEHVEDRLRDYFAGRPNYWVEYFRSKHRSSFPDIVTFYKQYGYDYKLPEERKDSKE